MLIFNEGSPAWHWNVDASEKQTAMGSPETGVTSPIGQQRGFATAFFHECFSCDCRSTFTAECEVWVCVRRWEAAFGDPEVLAAGERALIGTLTAGLELINDC